MLQSTHVASLDPQRFSVVSLASPKVSLVREAKGISRSVVDTEIHVETSPKILG